MFCNTFSIGKSKKNCVWENDERFHPWTLVDLQHNIAPDDDNNNNDDDDGDDNNTLPQYSILYHVLILAQKSQSPRVCFISCSKGNLQPWRSFKPAAEWTLSKFSSNILALLSSWWPRVFCWARAQAGKPCSTCTCPPCVFSLHGT